MFLYIILVFFQAEDGIRDLVRSRGLGDVYKRQPRHVARVRRSGPGERRGCRDGGVPGEREPLALDACLLYTSDAADERSSVDLGGRRIIKKKTSVCVALKRYVLTRTAETMSH